MVCFITLCYRRRCFGVSGQGYPKEWWSPCVVVVVVGVVSVAGGADPNAQRGPARGIARARCGGPTGPPPWRGLRDRGLRELSLTLRAGTAQ